MRENINLLCVVPRKADDSKERKMEENKRENLEEVAEESVAESTAKGTYVNKGGQKASKTISNTVKVETMVMAALMTALVVVFQCIATYTTFFGPFSTAIGLIPIVIGAVLCGPVIGGWLGFVFGIVVIATGGANLFFAFHIFGTVVTVLVKGIACGVAAGAVYKLLERFNKIVALVVAALACPIVNTGIFLLGTVVFFMPFADAIAELLGLAVSGFAVFVALAFGNFLFEIGMSAVLSPVMIRVIDVAEKTFRSKRRK